MGRQLLDSINLKTLMVFSVFLFSLFALFYRIADYPNYPNYCVPDGVKFQVESLLDKEAPSANLSWVWQDSYSNNAGQSILFGSLNKIGLKLFGFSILGIRLLPTILSFISLILLYIAVRRYSSCESSLAFIAILVSSPTFLTISRSGSFISFSISIVVISISILLLYLKRPTVYGIVLLALSVLSLPYGHTLARPYPALIVLLLFINRRKLGKHHLLVFFLIIGVGLIPQMFDFRHAITKYFSARGESMLDKFFEINHSGGDGIHFLISKLSKNLLDMAKMLVGLQDNFLFPVVASNWWREDVALYLPVLCPFLLIGMIASFMRPLWAILFFLTILPGLASGLGGPSIIRIAPVIIPIAYFISRSFELIVSFITRLRGRRILFSSLVIIVSIAQLMNYFLMSRDNEELFNSNGYEYAYEVTRILDDNPKARIALYSEVFLRGDYVLFRLVGGDEVRRYIENGQIRFLYDERIPKPDEILKQFDYILLGHEFIYEKELKQSAVRSYVSNHSNKRVVVLEL